MRRKVNPPSTEGAHYEANVFSHTLEEQVGGQLRAGFVLKEVLEDTNVDDKFGEYNIPTAILTRTKKPRG